MTPPKCRVCGAAHWSNAPHVFAKQEQLELEGVRLHGFEDARPVTKKVAPVTEKPKALPKKGRPKKERALTPAEKQKAYRQRKLAKNPKGTDPITGRPRRPPKV
jgi:hypothetical protein